MNWRLNVTLHRYDGKIYRGANPLVSAVGSFVGMQATVGIERGRSAALFEEAKHLFPGGVNSPVRAFKSVSGPPVFVDRAEGPYLFDVDGNRFIDFCGSWGPIILGHDNPGVREDVIAAVRKGTSFGTPTASGNKLGELILSNNPYIDRMRFVSSGTEAVMSAIRLARGYTGREYILKFEGCYHGHVDSLLVKAGSGLVTFGTSSSAGVPEGFIDRTLVAPLGDTDRVHEIFREYGDRIAAVIVEPVPANNGLLLQDRQFLNCLRTHCYGHGSLLVFDEVISGFRVGFTGAAGHYDIRPDILTYGKIIGGGMPVGAYGATGDIMASVAPEGPVYQAGTLSANPVAMAAGAAVCRQLLEPGFYESQRSRTLHLSEQIQTYADGKGYELTVPSIASIFWFSFSRERISRADQIEAAGMTRFRTLHHELLQREVYLGPSGYEVGFISAAHTEAIIDEAVNRITEALDIVFA